MNKNSGFSLIELLVGMTIALLSLVALSEIYLTTKQTNRIQLIQSRLSEDGRFAISIIQRSLNQTGYRNNTATALASDRITGTAAQVSLLFDSDGTNQIGCDVSSAANGAHSMSISKSANTLQCIFDGGSAISWLNGASSETGSSSDVISLKFEYGIDTGPATNADFGCGADAGSGNLAGDCIADIYVSTIPNAGLGYTADKVMSVRVCLVLRSEQSDSSIIKSTAVKDCNGTDIAGSQNDKKLYRQFNTTVVLKNR